MPDTIAAIATASAAAAVGIVRLSGAETRCVLAALFTPVDGRSAAELPPRRMTYGTVRDAEGRTLDHALAVVFSAGHSYTGEESAELHCHGSPVVLQEVLRAAFAAGARQARAGEFTERAFLNGKMDLTEAEAVIDLIDAETAEAARNAAAQVDGALRRPLEQVYDALLGLTSRFYAVVDYPDEDIEDLTLAETERTLTESEQTLAALLGTFARGRVLKSGAATAIVGAPNAGKSSLFNALMGTERAIVTSIPGTTRDTLEETMDICGAPVRITDTAGIREGADEAERIGVGTLICTDISRDGAMRGTNRELYRMLSEQTGMNIIASGGVSGMDDIHALRALGLYGAIGRAYYTGDIRLAEAIGAAR